MIGDLVRIAPRIGVSNSWERPLGLVVGFVGLQNTAWSDPNELCAKIEWTSGTQTVTGLPMLERVG